MKVDRTLASLYGNARDFATEMEEPINTFHFLLSSFITPCEVSAILAGFSIDDAKITRIFKGLSENDKIEPEGTIKAIEAKVLENLQRQDELPSALHFFYSMILCRDSIAFKIFSLIGVREKLRLEILRMINTPATRNKILEEEMRSDLVEEVVPVKKEIIKTNLKEKDNEEESVSEQKELNSNSFDIPEILFSMGRNLTEAAFKGELTDVTGREKEINMILDILGRKNNNNPCLIGPSGCGKTSVIEGIALRQKNGILKNKIIWELTLASLVSGTEYRGSLEKKISELINVVEKLKDKIVIFIDEIHLLNSSSNEIVANILKPSLSRGAFPLIGTTTYDEFKRHIASDPALERRFTIVDIEPPDGEELYNIAFNAAKSLTKFHSVKMDDEELVRDAILLSNRYISGKSQPDKVISLIDSVGAVLARDGRTEAEKSDFMELVSNRTGIPLKNLLLDGGDVFRRLPSILNEKIKGQEHAKKKICKLLARRFVIKKAEKPIAAFVFAGPTGTGKTEIAKILSDFFFGSEQKMISFDMSEFQEQHSVARLTGAPPGYVGYDEGGQLTEAFRREPYQLLLLDEIEKAHPKVLSIFLQILDEGRVSDSRGFTVNMSESIIVMTTNLGAEEFTSSRVGFVSDDKNDSEIEDSVLAKIESFLSPELVNRVDEIAVFKPFTEKEFTEIAEMYIRKTVKSVSETYDIKLNIEDIESVSAYIAGNLSDKQKKMGARAVRRSVEKQIEDLAMDFVYQNGSESSFSIYYNKEKDFLTVR